jgi:hypothetical protein
MKKIPLELILIDPDFTTLEVDVKKRKAANMISLLVLVFSLTTSFLLINYV